MQRGLSTQSMSWCNVIYSFSNVVDFSRYMKLITYSDIFHVYSKTL